MQIAVKSCFLESFSPPVQVMSWPSEVFFLLFKWVATDGADSETYDMLIF